MVHLQLQIHAFHIGPGSEALQKKQHNRTIFTTKAQTSFKLSLVLNRKVTEFVSVET